MLPLPCPQTGELKSPGNNTYLDGGPLFPNQKPYRIFSPSSLGRIVETIRIKETALIPKQVTPSFFHKYSESTQRQLRACHGGRPDAFRSKVTNKGPQALDNSISLTIDLPNLHSKHKSHCRMTHTGAFGSDNTPDINPVLLQGTELFGWSASPYPSCSWGSIFLQKQWLQSSPRTAKHIKWCLLSLAKGKFYLMPTLLPKTKSYFPFQAVNIQY